MIRYSLSYPRACMSSIRLLVRAQRLLTLWISGTPRYVSSAACTLECKLPMVLSSRSPKDFSCKLLQFSMMRYLCDAVMNGEGFLESVKKNLKSNLRLEEKQISMLTSPESLEMDALRSKNLELKLSAEEVFKLAIAVFQAQQAAGDKVDKAAMLFEYAHELGDMNAAYTFAQLLRGGQGCKADPARAVKIFTELSLKGHPYAQFALGAMYSAGLGTEQNFNRAFTLYKVSAQNQVPEAYRAMGDMCSSGQGVEENLEEAFKCYEKAAELGDVLAQLSIARCYNHGKGVEQSFEKGFKHHMDAAKAGILIGIYNVGVQYFAGKGVEQCYDKAVEYFQKASDRGFTLAQINLGNMYFTGFGVPEDWQKAKKLYEMAATENKNAQLLLEELEDAERKKLAETEE